MHPAKLLRLHFNESARFEGRLLYEAIIDRCREMQIAGATVFRGLEGFGETTELHRSHLMSHDQPIVVVVVDTEDRISALVPVLEKMLPTGLIALTPVQMTRVQNG
jgi:PII-like signaling protein